MQGFFMKQVNRLIEDTIIQSLEAFPVVYLAGPRQSGKTTLAQRIAETRHKAQYITFDDIQMRSSAQRDPDAFLRSLPGPVILDEIQMVPQLFRPLKIIVDENRRSADGGRGRFLLTGSASVMALPALSDALVGRMVLHELLPLCSAEIQATTSTSFIDRAFSDQWHFDQLPKIKSVDRMIQASFPELLTLSTYALRHTWCNGYVNTLLQRDVHTLMEIEKIESLPQLLRLFATRTGGLLNESSLSRDCGLNHVTAKRYRLLLESLFFLQSVPAWTHHLGKRLIKSPKIYLSDLNILAYLLDIDLQALETANPVLGGRVLENFVAIELEKQRTFSQMQTRLYHYRTNIGQEIDFLLEGPQNHIVGIEVKANSKVTHKDFAHLESLKEDLGAQFQRGFVLYQGTDIAPFGERMWALPLSVLWQSGHTT
jgi:uncharacterized protein